MLNVDELVEGVTKVRILKQPMFVEQPVGDVGVFIKLNKDYSPSFGVDFGCDKLYWFNKEDLEIVKDKSISSADVPNEGVSNEIPSEDLIIYKSRWDEIIENLHKPLNCMSDEEVGIVKSVLKNNIPFNVVPDLKVIDTVIEKEDQTHLDATHIGDTGHFNLYYKSTLLNKLFWWNSTSWVESSFNYEDDGDLIPISFGESK